MKAGTSAFEVVFDIAERPTEVNEVTGLTTSRPLKVLTYGTANVGTDKRLGKLETATRYNYVDVATLIGQQDLRTYVVTERNTYTGRGGRLGHQWTDFYEGTTELMRFEQGRSLNDLGELESLDYPNCYACEHPNMISRRQVTLGYDYGLLTEIGGAVLVIREPLEQIETVESAGTLISYHPTGQVAQIDHSGDQTETWTLDPTGPSRPGRIEVQDSTGATLWTSGDYRFDGAGNIVEMGGSWFRYDGVSRLVEARVMTDRWASSGEQAQTYAFDGFGNLQGISGVQAYGTPTSKTSNRLTSAVYDNSGNLTNWLSTTYRYDALGSMWRTTAGAEDWVYVYNADGERVFSKKLGGETFHRYTLRDPGGQELRTYTQTGQNSFWDVEMDHLWRGDKLLSTYALGQGIRSTFTDHLGSPRLVLGGDGAVTAFHTYFPFGAEATSPFQDSERMKFTGHVRDLGDPNSTGDDLDYMHARFCSPVWGRFLAVDPSHESRKPRFPQSWNRYSYARNNPINRYDPDGRADMGSGFSEEIHTSCGNRACGSSEPSMQVLNGLLLFTGVGPLAASPAMLGPGGLAAGGSGLVAFQGVSFSRFLATLTFTSAPAARDPRLQNAIGQLFRASDRLAGGTAGAIFNELKTGQLVGGRGHIVKGLERVVQLDKLIAGGNLGAGDLAVAQGLRGDLLKALEPLTQHLKLPANQILAGVANGTIKLPGQ